ncbi:MAG: hypothetical protein AB7U85_01705 [Alphaproteobacteria bacterium]
MNKCFLCGEDKKLIKAHIIPEKYFTKTKKLQKIYSYDGDYPKKNRIGVYDNEILCSDCDGKLGKYDEYSYEVLFNLEKFICERDKNGIKVKNIDSNKLKLFYLSIIWRAHISKRPEFKKIDLGEKYSKIIKNSLLNNKLPEASFFEISIWKHYFENNKIEEDDIDIMFFSPIKHKFEQTNCYIFLFGGYSHYIKIDNRSRFLDDCLIVKNSEFAIPLQSFEKSLFAKPVNKIIARN